MSIINKLLGRLSSQFDRSPASLLGLRLSYQTGVMTWEIADDVLSTTVLGGVGQALSVDLTQYTLAIDRSDEQVAHLYDPLHPAVLRLIQFATQAALRARIPISVCGEIAGDPRFTALLLGLGVRELSMTPNKLAVVKRRIRALDLRSATRRAQSIMDQSDSARIAEMLDEFNESET